ncbi:MAG: T9SS type A sorting domain-containing protein [Bacteroidota bacterium]
MKKIVTILRNQLLLVLFCLSTSYAQNNAADVVHLESITQNLKAPVRFAIDAADNIYVTDDYQKLVLKYDANGSFLNSFTVGVSPLSIAINKAGQIFIGDKVSGKIFKVNPDGSSSEFFSGCIDPNTMIFDPDGMLYITDGVLKKVLVLDVSAKLVRTIGEGTLTFPTAIVYDQRNNRILVAEHGGLGSGMTPPCKIWIFNLDGVLQGSFATAGNGNGQFYRIQGMAVGKCGNLYVCDPFQGNISVFNHNNVFLMRFGQFGTQAGQLNVPTDILFDSKERILITTINNGALEVYRVTDTLPTSNIANSDAVICAGQSANIKINFTGIAPWTFTYTIDGLNPTSITTSDNPYVLSATQSGLYEVTALTDASKTGSCFSGSALIKVNSLIPATNMPSGNVSICTGSTFEIPVHLSGSSPWNITYTLNGTDSVTVQTADNPFIIKANNQGQYEVVAVNSGGCEGNVFTGLANVSVNPLPVATFSGIAQKIAVCSGESALIPLDFTGAAPWTFSYSLNGAAPISILSYDSHFNLSATQGGIYNLIGISDTYCANGQQDSREIILKPIPSATMTEVNATVCHGNIVEIPLTFTGNSPFTFTYSVDDTLFNTVSTSDHLFNMPVNTPGNYQIVSLEGDGCAGTSFSGSALIKNTPIPTAAFEDGNAQLIICDGQTASLPVNFSGAAPWTITYTINNISQASITTSDNPYVINTTTPGVYEIQSVSDLNCVNASTLGTPEVVVIPLPSSVMTATQVSYCFGSSAAIPITFSGMAPWNFTFSFNGLTSGDFTTSDSSFFLAASAGAGNYQVVAISSYGCVGSEMTGTTTVVENPAAVPAFTYNANNMEITFTNNSQNASSFSWNFGDGQASSSINPVHLYAAPIVYNVMLTASNGLCADSTSTQIINLIWADVNNKGNGYSILVFPNPSSGHITIIVNWKDPKPWTLEITNALGQLVYSGNHSLQKESIDVSSFPAGIYTLKIIIDKIARTEKLLINR